MAGQHRRRDAAGDVKPRQESLLFGLEQALAPGVKVLPGGLGETADGVLAEDRFQQPLVRRRRCRLRRPPPGR